MRRLRAQRMGGGLEMGQGHCAEAKGEFRKKLTFGFGGMAQAKGEFRKKLTAGSGKFMTVAVHGDPQSTNENSFRLNIERQNFSRDNLEIRSTPSRFSSGDGFRPRARRQAPATQDSGESPNCLRSRAAKCRAC